MNATTVLENSAARETGSPPTPVWAFSPDGILIEAKRLRARIAE